MLPQLFNKHKFLWVTSLTRMQLLATYCRIRDIHTSLNEDCKNPDAITILCMRTVLVIPLSISLLFSQPSASTSLYRPYTSPGGVSRGQKWSKQERAKIYLIAPGSSKLGWSQGVGLDWENTHRPCITHSTLQAGLSVKTKLGCHKRLA